MVANQRFCGSLNWVLTWSTPAGLSAFAYAVVGYGVAMIGVPRGVGPVVGMFAVSTFVSQLLYGLGALLLGPSINASPLITRARRPPRRDAHGGVTLPGSYGL